MVQNPPSNTDDAGLIPGLGTKIPHAEGPLSLLAATTEPAHHKSREARTAHQRRSMRGPTCCNPDPSQTKINRYLNKLESK